MLVLHKESQISGVLDIKKFENIIITIGMWLDRVANFKTSISICFSMREQFWRGYFEGIIAQASKCFSQKAFQNESTCQEELRQSASAIRAAVRAQSLKMPRKFSLKDVTDFNQNLCDTDSAKTVTVRVRECHLVGSGLMSTRSEPISYGKNIKI